jgi:glc operon protein GlcG
MRRVSLLMICLAVLLSTEARAQQPASAPVPEIMPYDIPYGAPITLERAKQVASVAEAEAKKHNWKFAIAIADQAGDVVYFLRIDDTQYASFKIAQDKARASARFRRPTKFFHDVINGATPAGPRPSLLTLSGVSGSAGGIPLIEKGKVIGAIGVSGGNDQQDEIVAKAAADTVK